LAIAIALGAWALRKRSSSVDPVAILGRNAWATGVITFLTLGAAMLTAAHNHALSGDEHLALFQSRIFAAGHLTGEFPPELVYRLIPTNYLDRWLIATKSGQVASVYWPGFALMLVPFT